MNASPELGIHRAIMAYLRVALPDALIVHIPNQMDVSDPRVRRAVAKNVSMGMVKGFPDIMVLADAAIGPVFFEVKAPKGRVSPDQAEIIRRLQALRYRCAVVRSIDDVHARMAEWGIRTAVHTTGSEPK
jgi:predicted P-loop ATPase/GTPase